MKSDKQISLRLPKVFTERAKELAQKLKVHPHYKFVPRMGVSVVLKLAIDRGLDELEKELNNAE